MLEGPNTTTSDAPAQSAAMPDASPQTLQDLRALLERLQGELKFKWTRIEVPNFEIARLKRWRFGSSSESLDTSTQTVLFDSLLIDTALEDRAADEVNKSPASPPRAKGQAVRRPPACLASSIATRSPRPTAPAAKHSNKLAKRSASSWTACRPSSLCCATSVANTLGACYQTIADAPMPAQMIDKDLPAPGLLAQVVVAKLDDHLSLYRQEEIYARSGAPIRTCVSRARAWRSGSASAGSAWRRWPKRSRRSS